MQVILESKVLKQYVYRSENIVVTSGLLYGFIYILIIQGLPEVPLLLSQKSVGHGKTLNHMLNQFKEDHVSSKNFVSWASWGGTKMELMISNRK